MISSAQPRDWLYYLVHPSQLISSLPSLTLSDQLTLLRQFLIQADSADRQTAQQPRPQPLHPNRQLDNKNGHDRDDNHPLFNKATVLDVLALQTFAHLQFNVNLLLVTSDLPLTLVARLYRILLGHTLLLKKHDADGPNQLYLTDNTSSLSDWSNSLRLLSPTSLYAFLLYHLWSCHVQCLTRLINHPVRNTVPALMAPADVPNHWYRGENRLIGHQLVQGVELSIGHLERFVTLLNSITTDDTPLVIRRPSASFFIPKGPGLQTGEGEDGIITNVVTEQDSELLSPTYMTTMINFVLGRHAFQLNAFDRAANYFVKSIQTFDKLDIEFLPEVGINLNLLRTFHTAADLSVKSPIDLQQPCSDLDINQGQLPVRQLVDQCCCWFEKQQPETGPPPFDQTKLIQLLTNDTICQITGSNDSSNLTIRGQIRSRLIKCLSHLTASKSNDTARCYDRLYLEILLSNQLHNLLVGGLNSSSASFEPIRQLIDLIFPVESDNGGLLLTSTKETEVVVGLLVKYLTNLLGDCPTKEEAPFRLTTDLLTALIQHGLALSLSDQDHLTRLSQLIACLTDSPQLISRLSDSCRTLINLAGQAINDLATKSSSSHSIRDHQDEHIVADLLDFGPEGRQALFGSGQDVDMRRQRPGGSSLQVGDPAARELDLVSRLQTISSTIISSYDQVSQVENELMRVDKPVQSLLIVSLSPVWLATCRRLIGDPPFILSSSSNSSTISSSSTCSLVDRSELELRLGEFASSCGTADPWLAGLLIAVNSACHLTSSFLPGSSPVLCQALSTCLASSSSGHQLKSPQLWLISLLRHQLLLIDLMNAVCCLDRQPLHSSLHSFLAPTASHSSASAIANLIDWTRVIVIQAGGLGKLTSQGASTSLEVKLTTTGSNHRLVLPGRLMLSVELVTLACTLLIQQGESAFLHPDSSGPTLGLPPVTTITCQSSSNPSLLLLDLYRALLRLDQLMLVSGGAIIRPKGEGDKTRQSVNSSMRAACSQLCQIVLTIARHEEASDGCSDISSCKFTDSTLQDHPRLLSLPIMALTRSIVNSLPSSLAVDASHFASVSQPLRLLAYLLTSLSRIARWAELDLSPLFGGDDEDCSTFNILLIALNSAPSIWPATCSAALNLTADAEQDGRSVLSNILTSLDFLTDQLCTVLPHNPLLLLIKSELAFVATGNQHDALLTLIEYSIVVTDGLQRAPSDRDFSPHVVQRLVRLCRLCQLPHLALLLTQFDRLTLDACVLDLQRQLESLTVDTAPAPAVEATPHSRSACGGLLSSSASSLASLLDLPPLIDCIWQINLLETLIGLSNVMGADQLHEKLIEKRCGFKTEKGCTKT